MQKTQRKKKQAYEELLSGSRYLGRNSFGAHASLTPDQSRELTNWDIFAGVGADDFLKSRRGSAVLAKASSPTKRGSTDVLGAVTWDIGSEEYLITQEGTSFYSQALLTTGDPVLIALATGGAFTVTNTTQADMFLSGDKLYIFHPGGNYVLRWTGSAFVSFPMGLVAPVISALTTATAGAISGSYTVGIEKVYQVSGVDIMASTPNRKTTARILAVTGTIASKRIKVTIQATELDNDTLWTHLRFWRSKNKNSDTTDPANPIDPQGNDSELYEEALITKAEMGAGSLTSIATGATLPPGNAGTQAGKPASVYTIEVNNADSVFFNLLGIDRIELLPIPAAAIGCFHANKIFFSGVVDTALDDASKNNIWYSNYAGTKYAFQYNPLNFIDTGRDGQQMMRLISLEKDLIGIKEAKTGRLPGGNVDLAFEVLDHGIGISNKNLAKFVPALGIVAVVNDFGDFRIFGYDLRWAKVMGEIDISIPVRNETAALTAANVTFIYVNGKVMISDGTGILYVLHQKEGRGWTRYSYPLNSVAQRFFTFANGARAAVVSKSTHLVEIEKSGVDADYSTEDDASTNAITLVEITHRFQSRNGRDILEFEYLDVEASLTSTMAGVPFANGLPWPSASSEAPTAFVPDPDIHEDLTALSDREYRLYLSPETVGSVGYGRLLGNFLHFKLTAIGPAVMRKKNLHVVVDEDGMGGGNFDPFQNLVHKPTMPEWTTGFILVLAFDIDSTTAKDFSGNNRDHAYAAGTGGTRTFDGDLIPDGGQSLTSGTGSGYSDDDWEALDYIGDDGGGLNTSSLTWDYVCRFPSLASPVIIHQGGDGVTWWKLLVNTDGSVEFDLVTTTLSYKFTTAASVITAGATDWVIQFVLSNGGLNGQFYVAARTSAFAINTTTRSAYP